MKTMRFDSNIISIENINPLFSKVLIKIAYPGLNRNFTYIDKSVFQKAIPTLFNCPIIGEFFTELDEFGSHGGRIIIDDKGIHYEETTQPYGVINEKSEIFWQTFTEEDGTTNEYLCATGYLWSSRYPELEKVIKESRKISMEIEVQSSKYTIIDNQNVVDIEDFIFSGLCILGCTTEPCFENADISSYSINYLEYKKQFNQMLKELKFSIQQDIEFQFSQSNQNQSSFKDVDINDNKGGCDLREELTELLQKYSLTSEQVLEFDSEINFEEISVEDFELKLQEFTKTEEDATELNPDTTNLEPTFSLTAKQIKDMIDNSLNADAPIDEWGYQMKAFWYLDHDDTNIWAEERESDWSIVQFSYTFIDNSISIDFVSKKYCRIAYVPVDGEENAGTIFSAERFEQDLLIKQKEFEIQLESKEKELKDNFAVERESISKDYQKQINKLNDDMSEITTEYNSLVDYKNNKIKDERDNAEQLLFDNFTNKLSDEEIDEFKKIANQFTLEQLEEKLYSALGRKNAQFSLKKPNEDLNKFSVTKPKKTNKSVDEPAWAEFVESHVKDED